MEKSLAIFFDASFFSEATLEQVRYFVDYPGPKYITDGVYDEITEGYANNPNHDGFSYIFKTNGKLKSKIQIISSQKCTKSPSMPDFSQRNILFKRHSSLCSAYYHWLATAINPSIPTDPFRHVYNAALHQIRKRGDPGDQISMLLGNLRQKEIEGINQIRRQEGYTGKVFYTSVLKTSRTKKLKDFKKNTLNLTDYQIVVTALLYLCLKRTAVLVLTCDKDLVEINEDLMRSVVEQYAVNSLLTEKLEGIDHNLMAYFKFLYSAGIIDKIYDTFNKISGSDSFCRLKIGYCDRSDGKIYGPNEKIPLWLMNFFLEYKRNIDCYSLDERFELKYSIKYVMDPTKRPGKIYFDITVRKEPFYNGFMPNCEDICFYARKERDNPLDFSSFV